jgi:hypothetical protein
MDFTSPNPFQTELIEKPANPPTALLATGASRRVFGAVHLTGKVTVVAGTQRLGKTLRTAPL